MSDEKKVELKTTRLLPHQERVVKERNELQEKIIKLRSFINSDKSKVLDDANYHALTDQLSVMEQYAEILLARIDLFDFTGDE